MAASAVASGGRSFRQTYALRLVLGFFLLGPAALFAWVAGDGQLPDSTISWSIAGALAAAYFILWVLISRIKLTISDMGIRRESAFGSKELLWPQISETRYVERPINWPVLFGLIGAMIAMSTKDKSAQLTLRVIGFDGTQIRITSNFQDAKDAIGTVLDRTMPALVANIRARIERGETVAFGSLSLSKSALTWKSKEPVPLGELSCAELAGAKLSIKRTGKWLSSVSVRSDKIPNVLALLEVLDGLAPQLNSEAIDPMARVRM